MIKLPSETPTAGTSFQNCTENISRSAAEACRRTERGGILLKEGVRNARFRRMSLKSTLQSSLLTRPTLLFRLRNWGDHSSWEEFHRLYRRFIHGLATRSGLTHTEADDVVQDVLKNVAERIHDYETRENRGAFRRWLMNQTRWRITDKFRQRDRAAVKSAFGREDRDDLDPLENLPEESPAGDYWELEWQRHVLDTAMERLARRAPAKHYQAFELYARQGWSVRRISTDLGINAATVYLIAHRLTKQLRQEVERLREHHG